jgi:hypothetical protein
MCIFLLLCAFTATWPIYTYSKARHYLHNDGVAMDTPIGWSLCKSPVGFGTAPCAIMLAAVVSHYFLETAKSTTCKTKVLAEETWHPMLWSLLAPGPLTSVLLFKKDVEKWASDIQTSVSAGAYGTAN